MTTPSQSQTFASPLFVSGGDRLGWLTARQGLITASDAAKVLGLSRFGGPMDVYLDKTTPVRERETAWLDAGRRFERVILEWYADINQVAIEFADPFEILLSPDPHFDRIGATLDARRLDHEAKPPVDAKLIDRPNPAEWGEPGTDVMPLYYAVQLVIQMHVTGAPFAELAVRFPTSSPVGFRLHRDLGTEREIIERCQHFYERHILGQCPPPPDGSDSYANFLKEHIREQSDRIVQASPELHAIATRRYALEAQKNDVEAQLQECDNLMKAAIGAGQALQGQCWRATWKTDRDSIGPDYEAIALVCATKACYDDARALGGTEDEIDARAEYAARAIIKKLAETHTRVTRKGPRKFLFNYSENV